MSSRRTGIKSREPIEVCIAIDTEFSIGDFDNPEEPHIAEPMVLGTIEGKEHGLGFLLDSFSEFDARATFFIEALQTAYFGEEPMGSIARRIADADHDVQLHLHPCWLSFQGSVKQNARGPPDDSCAGRTEAELDHFFQAGLSAFSHWGPPPPIAVRTGNFELDLDFYRAAARSGLHLSSSIAIPIYRPADESLVCFGGKHRIGQILELPVFCYSCRGGIFDRLRALCITACFGAEIIFVLRQALEHGLTPVTILTHPQEYIKKRDFRYTALRQNRVNQTRLTTLMKFLRQHRDDFVTVPISRISDDVVARGIDRPAVSVSFARAMARMLENGINDRIWWY